MGSGKSRTGKALAQSIGWEFIDLDQYIEHKMDQTVADLFEKGEEYFRVVEAEAVRDIVTMRQITGENLVLALGGGTLGITSVQWLIHGSTECVYLRAGLDTIISRLGTRSRTRPLYQGKYEIEDLFDSRTPVYETSEYSVDVDGKSVEEICNAIKAFFFSGN